MCRNSTAVHKVKCNNTKKHMLGTHNTSSKLACNNTSVTSKSLSNLVKNLADTTQFHDANPSSANQCGGGTTCSIIWQRNPLRAVKTFATKNCGLCAKEWIAILKQSRSNPQLLVNHHNKICGACGCRPHFHRCTKQTTLSTDESINDERVSPTCEVTTDFTRCNVCLADVQLEAL